MIEKARAGLGEAIDIGGLDLAISVAAEYPGRKILGHNQQNVRRLAGRLFRREGRQGEAAEEEMAAREGHGSELSV